jgi:hypothetical protein
MQLTGKPDDPFIEDELLETVGRHVNSNGIQLDWQYRLGLNKAAASNFSNIWHWTSIGTAWET